MPPTLIKNSCFDFLGKARICHFRDALEFRRMENQYFLDGGRKKLFCPGMVILEQKYHPGA
jgi:uncharacterized protein YigE (DUF2233 family)